MPANELSKHDKPLPLVIAISAVELRENVRVVRAVETKGIRRIVRRVTWKILLGSTGSRIIVDLSLSLGSLDPSCE